MLSSMHAWTVDKRDASRNAVASSGCACCMLCHLLKGMAAYLGWEVGVGIVAVQHALQLLVEGWSVQSTASQYAHELVNVCPISLQQSQRS